MSFVKTLMPLCLSGASQTIFSEGPVLKNISNASWVIVFVKYNKNEFLEK